MRLLLAVIVLLGVQNVFGQEPTSESLSLLTPTEQLDSNFEFHGFLSQGYVQSTNNNFLPNSTQGTTKFTEAGVNVNKQFTNDLRAGFQIFARDYGVTGDYRASFDWFLIDYHWRDYLGIRAGRIKLPFGLYNDTSDIDSARDPVLLPQSIYPIQDRDYLLAQTGVELYGLIDMGSRGGSLEYRLYRGTIQIDTPVVPPTSTIEYIDVNLPYVYGGRLIWEPPVRGLRAGVSVQRLQLDTDLYSTTVSKSASVDLPITMAVGSVEFTYRAFQFVAEYSKLWAKAESSDTSVYPEGAQTSEKYYAMATYKVRPWLHPGVYYSAAYPYENVRTSRQDQWIDYAGFVRIDLYSNWLLKFEAHYMDGTAALIPSYNGGTSTANMPRNWALFLAKTTVSF